MTAFPPGGYAEAMRIMSPLLLTLFGLVITLPAMGWAGEGTAVSIPLEDYARYDQVITSKFLTSQTHLVLIERKTTMQISPEQEGLLTAEWFQQQGFFEGTLPAELVRAFVAANQEPARLEGRFQFGTRYRFVTGDSVEEPEVSLGRPALAALRRPVQALPLLDRLVFSRVAYNVPHDLALLYVGNPRPDGSGAGFLVWLRRQGAAWSIWDTDVVWTIHLEREPDGGPLLAP